MLWQIRTSGEETVSFRIKESPLTRVSRLTVQHHSNSGKDSPAYMESLDLKHAPGLCEPESRSVLDFLPPFTAAAPVSLLTLA